MRKFLCVMGGLGMLAMSACNNPLDVGNRNDPDVGRLTGRPADLEKLIVDSWVIAHQATLGAMTAAGGANNSTLQPALLVLGMESYSGNSNFCMATRGAVPRNQIDNQRGNQCLLENYHDWSVGHRAARVAVTGIAKLNEPGYTIETPARDLRARAFGRFVQGVALANIAMVYDSGMVIADTDQNLETTLLPFVSYDSLMTYALTMLDSAEEIALRTAANGTGGFPIPAAWLRLPGSTAVSQADFVRYVRSYRARFRAGVARTPEERAAVDWAKVIADANAGITANYAIASNPTQGMQIVWPAQHYLFQSWHQAWQLIMGMADISGGYNTWLATADANKAPFLVVTPDTRFPAGADRPAQIAAAGCGASACTDPNPETGLYWRNRPAGSDALTSNPYANSFYDFFRFQAYNTALRVGQYPIMTDEEIALLAAEGYLRTGNVPAAIQRINVSRTRRGLPALTSTVASDPVPGGAACVPKVPDPATNFASAKCGNTMEALKWEYRNETAFTGYGMWYFAGRGWGDLPIGTPLQFPVPYQEMDVRLQSFYNYGGVGGQFAAPRGNYGI